MEVLNKTAEQVSHDAQRSAAPGSRSGANHWTAHADGQHRPVRRQPIWLNVADIQGKSVATAIGGREAGTLFEERRRSDILVRFPENRRNNLGACNACRFRCQKRLAPATAEGRESLSPRSPNRFSWPLAPIRSAVRAEAPRRGQRQCTWDVDGRIIRLGGRSWPAANQDPVRVLDHLGRHFRENLQSATTRLQIVVPVALLLVFVLLFAMFIR